MHSTKSAFPAYSPLLACSIIGKTLRFLPVPIEGNEQHPCAARHPCPCHRHWIIHRHLYADPGLLSQAITLNGKPYTVINTLRLKPQPK